MLTELNGKTYYVARDRTVLVLRSRKARKATGPQIETWMPAQAQDASRVLSGLFRPCLVRKAG